MRVLSEEFLSYTGGCHVGFCVPITAESFHAKDARVIKPVSFVCVA